jgi:NAD(P)H-dependent FMN reductase
MIWSPEAEKAFATCGSIRPIIEQAFLAYSQHKTPVVIIAEDGGILHGEATLKQIREYGVSLECATIKGVNRIEFEAGLAPEILEAARQVYWEGRKE